MLKLIYIAITLGLAQVASAECRWVNENGKLVQICGPTRDGRCHQVYVPGKGFKWVCS